MDAVPDECVGLLMGDGTVHRLINQARSSRRFLVHPRQIVETIGEAAVAGEGVAAMYHSHRGAPNPSGPDRDFMAGLAIAWPQVVHVILSPSGYKIWKLRDDNRPKEIV